MQRKKSIFVTDLNALIKYETGNSSKDDANVYMNSARRSKENDGFVRTEILVNANRMRSKSVTTKRTHATQTHEKKTVERSTQPDEKKDKEKQAHMERPLSTTAVDTKITNIHRECAKSKFPTKRILVKNTPVDLYQKYKSDWEKFKKYIPGENSREDVRKEVRTRVQKPPPPEPTVRISFALNTHEWPPTICH